MTFKRERKKIQFGLGKQDDFCMQSSHAGRERGEGRMRILEIRTSANRVTKGWTVEPQTRGRRRKSTTPSQNS